MRHFIRFCTTSECPSSQNPGTLKHQDGFGLGDRLDRFGTDSTLQRCILQVLRALCPCL